MANLQQVSAKQIKESVSLVDLLSRLGFRPVRNSGRELSYLSMLRDSDTTPSFSVNDKLSVWFDHGLGKGGNVVDFGLAYWPQLSFSDVLEKIVLVSGQTIPTESNTQDNRRPRLPVKIPNYEILEIKDLYNNPAITQYLQSRGILEAAAGRLREIYYFVEDQKKTRKHFFAAGWPNELGGWEVRNPYFKGCLGRKAVSFIAGDSNRLAVFEGFSNYLSWLTENPFASESVLVLNSLSLLQQAVRKAAQYDEVSVYFDNDNNGRIATAELLQAVPAASDLAAHYIGYNDYNDKLMADLRIVGISR